MKVVFVTQTLDADHPVLAQTLDLVAALARHADEVVVLCATVGRHDLPANVRVRLYGSGHRLGRGLRFLAGVAAELGRPRPPDALLAHMVPLFLLLAAPLAKLRGVRLLLWYTHGKSSRALRLATRLADVVLSADVRSFPLRSAKVRGVGHAIDVETFSPAAEPPPPSDTLRLLALGRFAPVKGYATVLEGLRLALERGLDARLEIRGPQLTEVERRHHADLLRLVRETPALRDRVTLEPALPRERVPALLREADVFVSATHARDSETFDKVVCEAGACGLPVVACNTALDQLLGGLPVELQFRAGDAESLARTLLDVGEAGSARRQAAGAELRRRIQRDHSVETWARRVSDALGDPTAK